MIMLAFAATFAACGAVNCLVNKADVCDLPGTFLSDGAAPEMYSVSNYEDKTASKVCTQVADDPYSKMTTKVSTETQRRLVTRGYKGFWVTVIVGKTRDRKCCFPVLDSMSASVDTTLFCSPTAAQDPTTTSASASKPSFFSRLFRRNNST